MCHVTKEMVNYHYLCDRLVHVELQNSADTYSGMMET